MDKFDTNVIEKGNKLYIMIGIPCSGKSTYAKMFLSSLNTIIISSDQIRKDLTGTYKYSARDNDSVFASANFKIEQALSEGYNVVFDATNTNSKYRRKAIDIGQIFNCHIVAVVLRTPTNICLERNFRRAFERKVPNEIILKMSSFNSNIERSEGFDEIVFVD